MIDRVGKLQITAATPESALLQLPWRLPLEEWPDEVLAALPRGISRHVVRFVKLGTRVLAVKETRDHFAYREYELLRTLGKRDIPSVSPVAVVTGRLDRDGEPLETCIITEHLPFSLPYRAVFSQAMRPETGDRLIDALAVLLVRLHLAGFFWGDVSLSNTLFRRDADRFAAYLVDAETGDFQEQLSRGQREYDIDLARTNIIGELFDLEAGSYLAEDFDAIGVGDRLVERYHELWDALTKEYSYPADEVWRIDDHIRHLNEIGFDVAELNMVSDAQGTSIRIEPKVVDAGHHSRRLLRLTGMDVQDNQARRMLNDMDAWRAHNNLQNESEQLVAHDWLVKAYEPALSRIPKELRGKLDSAQLFHEMLEHRWFLSQEQNRDVPMTEAADNYVDNVLRNRRDERALLRNLPGDTEIIAFNKDMGATESTVEMAAVAMIEAEDAAVLQLLRDEKTVDIPKTANRADPLKVAAEIAAALGESDIVVAGSAPDDDDDEAHLAHFGEARASFEVAKGSATNTKKLPIVVIEDQVTQEHELPAPPVRKSVLPPKS
jgi:hypothetical protein